jgi:hypothetical protein
MRKEPRWTVAFLRALERTGKVRWAAEDAGVDFTTAYARRKAHAEFAAAWGEALERGRAERDAARAEDLEETVATLRKAPAVPSPGSPAASPTSPPRTFRRTSSGGALRSASPLGEGGGDEYVVANGQLKRVGPGRWSKAKEQRFLAELATHGGIGRACRAIRLSREAVSKRRRTDRHLDAACKAAREIGRERLNDWLVEAGNETFDPADLPPGEELELPKVTVAEAIQIAKLGNARGAAAAPVGPQPYDVAEVEQRLAEKFAALREASLREGWQLDESWDCLVPPGWIQCGSAEP